jgi:uncharacterized protein (TIGR01244 family)
MDPRVLSPNYHVSPQIDPEDAAAIKAAGYALVICNRPDGEVPPSHQAAAVGAAVEAEGVAFKVLPVTHQTLTPALAAEQRQTVEAAGGPVLAYCASGTRSSILWAIGQAGLQPSDEIIGAAAQAGYDLAGLQPTLDALARG